jgi:F420-dependent oxidoreductase-like protein
MRIGLYLIPTPETGPAAVVEQVREAALAGIDSVFFGQLLTWDALTLAALSGPQVPGIELGTAVVPTYPRHPVALAGQALTAQAATGGRLTLGVGPSHGPVIEGVFHQSYDRPARHVREYLTVLGPLLRGEAVDHRGETFSATAQITLPGVPAPSLLLSALGPAMLRIAGELADGTVTVWTTPSSVAADIVPLVTRAATDAGRPAPRVVAGVVASVTADPERVTREVAERFAGVDQLPNYRAALDRQRRQGAHETILAGSAEEVARGLSHYAEAGATEVLVGPTGNAEEQARTVRLLAELCRERGPVAVG